MAIFRGTAGVDRLIGADDVVDLLQFQAADFSATDRVLGGRGPDRLGFTTPAAVLDDGTLV